MSTEEYVTKMRRIIVSDSEQHPKGRWDIMMIWDGITQTRIACYDCDLDIITVSHALRSVEVRGKLLGFLRGHECCPHDSTVPIMLLGHGELFRVCRSCGHEVA